MDIFELVESLVTDSNGDVISYTPNTNGQVSIDSNGQITVNILQGQVLVSSYVRVATTTTYSDKQVENSAYVPLILNIYGDHCVGQTVTATQSSMTISMQ